jgi:hypothetical protein
LERAKKIFERLLSNLKILSEHVGLPLPELKSSESTELKQDLEIGYGGREREEKVRFKMVQFKYIN